MVCFWVRIDRQGLAELRRDLGKSGRSVCVLANHASFLDTILSLSVQPLRLAGKFKMIVSNHVLKLPIVGRVATTMGHLAVPFKDAGENSTNFEVDKDALAKVMISFEDHLKSGGHCAWFPEGQVNKGDASQLQTFRAGGLGIAVRSDVEIWCITFVGNAVCWPKAASVGGFPARIGVNIFRMCESSKAFLESAELPGGDDERGKCIFLATHAQQEMQKIVDSIVKSGYNAGNNERKKRAIDEQETSKKSD